MISKVLSVPVVETRFPGVSVKSAQVLSRIQESDLRTQARGLLKMPGAQISFLPAGSDSFAYAVWVFICKSQICRPCRTIIRKQIFQVI